MREDEKLSQDTFERLIARAGEIDAEGKQRIDVTRAAEIARELGISDDAWGAALREHRRVNDEAPGAELRGGAPSKSKQVMAVALAIGAGLAAGVVMGVTSEWIRGWDFWAGATLLASSLAFVAASRKSPLPHTLARTALFWIAVPAGVMIGYGELLTDPIWFGVWSWIACAAVAFAWPRLLRRIGTPGRIASTPGA